MEKERLKFCIERFDHYYDSTNNKSGVFLAIGTFVLGGLIAGYPYIVENVTCSAWMYGSYYLSAALALTALIIVIWSATPYLTRGGESMYYYGSIASKSKEEFSNSSERQESDEDLADLRNQVHGLAKGLSQKFGLLYWAGRVYLIMFIAIAVFAASILINLKTSL
ncbi:Pycsar system effector family protein [Mangrovibacterium marinum]|uniref:Pycsar system effector family protein n=1 Tax=Mangrovibacterium marinum TaxID=1639118 RepID=UPI002A18745E|nr:Pycsar system effector family protein [Mangrovibacterium marinum]